MGKRYMSDGSANVAFAGNELSGSEENKLKQRIRDEVPAIIEAGNLELLAEISATTANRLERVVDKMPNNPAILQKIVHALDVISDPARVAEWRRGNTAVSILRADEAVA